MNAPLDQPRAAPIDRSLDRTLVRGMVVVATFAAIAGAARIGQDVVIAWRFGTGPVVDAYYFLLNLANWPVAVAMSVLTFLVASSAVRQARDLSSASPTFRAELLGAVLAAALMSWPLAWWALSHLAASPAGGLAPEASALAAAAVPAMAAVVALGLIGALLAAWLVAAGRHSLALLEALPSMVLIVALLVMPGTVLFWATALGVALQGLAMALLLRRDHRLQGPRLGFSATAWRSFIHGGVALLAGQVLFALLPLIDTLFAARLGEGTVSALNFANRLVLGLQGLAGLALQRVSLPLLARLQASPDAARRTVLRWALATAVLGLVMGTAVAATAESLVALLFERGRFTAADRELVALLLRFGMLQMPVFLGGLLFVTALASAGAMRTLAVAAGIGCLAKLLFSFLLVPAYGVQGLLMATALMYTVTSGITWFAWCGHLRRLTNQLKPSE